MQTTAILHDQITTIGAMTTADFQTRRKAVTESYGESAKEAGVRREQVLAQLFAETNWTQEKLAQEDGKYRQGIGLKALSRPYIAQLLTFGRFLNVAIATNAETWLFNVKEGQFREFWRETSEHANERQRFAATYKLLEEHIRIGKSTAKKSGIAKQIIDTYADGKWHKLATITAGVDVPEQEAISVLELMRSRGTYKCHCERRNAGRSYAYRIVKGGGRKVDMEQLMSEARPILQDLKAEVTKSYAVYSPQTLQSLITRLEKSLEALAK